LEKKPSTSFYRERFLEDKNSSEDVIKNPEKLFNKQFLTINNRWETGNTGIINYAGETL